VYKYITIHTTIVGEGTIKTIATKITMCCFTY